MLRTATGIAVLAIAAFLSAGLAWLVRSALPGRERQVQGAPPAAAVAVIAAVIVVILAAAGWELLS